MTTTMLDALAAESARLTEDAKVALVLLQGVVTRSAALSQQIDVLIAGGERLIGGDADLISSFASVEDFAAFQARHFPYRAIQSKVRAGSYPAAQDDGQGNQGSAVSQDALPAGAEDTKGEAEQGVTAEASEERDAPRVDAEAAPELEGPSLKDRTLDIYAVENLTQRELSKRVDCALTTLQAYLTQARRSGDQRVAKGDLLRAEAREAAAPMPAKAGEITLPKVDRDEHDVAGDIAAAAGPVLKDGEVLSIDQNTCIVSRDMQSIQLARHEMRMVRALNSGVALSLEDMLQAAGVMTGRRLDSEVAKINPRIAQIGVSIVKTSAGEFQLSTER